MPDKWAKIIFNESLGSLMAHTIRAVTKYLLQRGIELELRIMGDTANAVTSEDHPGAISMLRTRLKKIPNSPLSRLYAYIYIHPHANRRLARICIAHEIFHLILEFEAFIESDRKVWKQLPVDEKIEAKCNEFARRLLKFHDDFNKSAESRKEYMYFPDHFFDNPLNLRDPKNWPDEIKLDPKHPFYEPPEG